MRLATRLILLLLFLLNACSPSDAPLPPTATNGLLDLSNWNFQTEDPIELSGEWEFYWSQLLSPDQIDLEGLNPRLGQVPAAWTSYADGLSVEGYATYRLRVQAALADGVFGVFLDGQGSSYQIWVNGKVIASDGDVGTELTAYVRSGKPQVVFLESQDSTMEIVVQISNYSHRSAGFRNPILLGTAESIHSLERSASMYQAIYLLSLIHI